MRMVLHVGLHKTGSSFLQKEFFPRIPNINYVHGNRLHNLVNNGDLTLISNEAILGIGYYPEENNYLLDSHTRLKKIKNLFNNPKIIIGLREPSSLIYAFYKQYLIEGGDLDFRDYLQKNPNISLDKRLAEIVDQVFIEFREDVYFFLQEDLLSHPEKIIFEILDFIGLSDCFDSLIIDFNIKTNVSVHDSFVPILLRLNKFNKRSNGLLNRYIIKRVGLDPRNICQNILPKLFNGKNSSDLSFLKNHYSKEWSYVLERIKKGYG